MIEMLKDLILSAAAITGAIVAIKGLSTWQKQLKGQVEYALARRLLVSLFKYRDAINDARHPVVRAQEKSFPPEEKAKEMSQEQIHFYGLGEAYQARWNKVQSERVNLCADLLEAEALWGDELKRLFKTIYDLEHELSMNIRLYLEAKNPETDDGLRRATHKIRKERRDIMYDDLSDEGDDYKKEFRKGVENIERYLKPKLGH